MPVLAKLINANLSKWGSKGIEDRGKRIDEHRTSNTRLPCITNDGGMIIVTGPRHQDILPRPPRHCGQVERRTSNEKQKKMKEGLGDYLATDAHRLTQTFVQQALLDKKVIATKRRPG